MRMLPLLLPLLLLLPFNSQTFLRWLNFNLPQVLKMICKMQKFHVINSCPASEPSSRPKHTAKEVEIAQVYCCEICEKLNKFANRNTNKFPYTTRIVAHCRSAAPINCNIKQLQMEPSEKLINGQSRHTDSDIHISIYIYPHIHYIQGDIKLNAMPGKKISKNNKIKASL